MKNKKLAIRLLSRDCEITCQYVNGKNTCAVGCLALASGVSRAALKKVNDLAVTAYEVVPLTEKIWDKFGLGLAALRKIQTANDNHETVDERRRAVLHLIQLIP